jgi:FdhE protein
LIVETVNPGTDAVGEFVDAYIVEHPEFAEALRMYGAIMEAQQSALESIPCPTSALEPGQWEVRLASGQSLLDPRDVEIDAAGFRALVARICKVLDEARPDGLSYRDELSAWDGLSEERIERTRDMVLSGEELDFRPSSELSPEDLELVRNILWEALTPFYRKSAEAVASDLEQSLWQRGSCPVCGGNPLMGKYRREDGLWLVECSLCHTLWNLQRARCPFCDESEGSLEYLFIDEDKSRRVNYCSKCKRYVKTVDVRESDKDALLPLEDLITVQLDLAASQEGLKNS